MIPSQLLMDLEPTLPYAVIELSSLEDLLQSVQGLEESLLDLPSIEDHIAQVNEVIKQIEEGPEEYLSSP